jgi:hypothetical protein
MPSPIHFEVQYEGKKYQCLRVVEGKTKIRQTISVLGMGLPVKDSVIYGEPDGKPVEFMEKAARTSAVGILPARIR